MSCDRWTLWRSGYDARGLLLSEIHHELGTQGNGSVSYQPDAFGQPRRVRYGPRDLPYLYDEAGRLERIVENRLWAVVEGVAVGGGECR
ncbi:MAG: hypothetical protein GY722_10610 [bacterium]|nr:hypothetical protein [bacterium]